MEKNTSSNMSTNNAKKVTDWDEEVTDVAPKKVDSWDEDVVDSPKQPTSSQGAGSGFQTTYTAPNAPTPNRVYGSTSPSASTSSVGVNSLPKVNPNDVRAYEYTQSKLRDQDKKIQKLKGISTGIDLGDTPNALVIQNQYNQELDKSKQERFALSQAASIAQGKVNNTLNNIINSIDENKSWDRFIGKDIDGFQNANIEAIDAYSRKVAKDSGAPETGYFQTLVKNKLKATAEYKIIEPEINSQFEKLHKEKFGKTPSQYLSEDFEKVFKEDEKINKATSIELNNVQKDLSEKAKIEATPINDGYKTFADNLNANYTKVQSEIQQQANQLSEAYKSGKINEQTYSNQFKDLESKLKDANSAYSKEIEQSKKTYLDELNKINNKYNVQFKRQQSEIVRIANEELKKKAEAFNKTYKPNPEYLKQTKELYSKAFETVSDAKKEAKDIMDTFQGGGQRWIQGYIGTLGNSINGIATSLNMPDVALFGESLANKYQVGDSEIKSLSDLLNLNKVINSTSSLAGGMTPSMLAAFPTGGASVALGAGAMTTAVVSGVAAWGMETMDMAGNMYNDILAETGNVAEAKSASDKIVQSQVALMPTYAIEMLPFVHGGLSAVKSKLGKVVAGAAIEYGSEYTQEFPQNIFEQNIREGRDYNDLKTITNNYTDFTRIASQAKSTALNLLPMIGMGVVGGLKESDVKDEQQNKRIQAIASSEILQQRFNQYNPYQFNQYIQGIYMAHGENFVQALAEASFANGTIDKEVYGKILDQKEKTKELIETSKSLGLSVVDSKLYNVLMSQFDEEMAKANNVDDVNAKAILIEKAKKYNQQAIDVLNLQKVPHVIVKYGNGIEMVWTQEQAENAMNDDAFVGNYLNGNIDLTLFNTEKGFADKLNTKLKDYNAKEKSESKVNMEQPMEAAPTEESKGVGEDTQENEQEKIKSQIQELKNELSQSRVSIERGETPNRRPKEIQSEIDLLEAGLISKDNNVIESNISENDETHLMISADVKTALSNGRKKQIIIEGEDGKPIVDEVDFDREDADTELDRLEALAKKGRLTPEEFQKSYFGQATDIITFKQATKRIKDNAVNFIADIRKSFDNAESKTTQAFTTDEKGKSEPIELSVEPSKIEPPSEESKTKEVQAKIEKIERDWQEKLSNQIVDATNIRNANTKEELDKSLMKAFQEDTIQKALNTAGMMLGKDISSKYYNKDYSFKNEVADAIEDTQKSQINKINAEYNAELDKLKSSETDPNTPSKQNKTNENNGTKKGATIFSEILATANTSNIKEKLFEIYKITDSLDRDKFEEDYKAYGHWLSDVKPKNENDIKDIQKKIHKIPYHNVPYDSLGEYKKIQEEYKDKLIYYSDLKDNARVSKNWEELDKIKKDEQEYIKSIRKKLATLESNETESTTPSEESKVKEVEIERRREELTTFSKDRKFIKGVAHEIQIQKKFGIEGFDVDVSNKSNTSTGFLYSNVLSEHFDTLEEAIEYANQIIQGDKEYIKKVDAELAKLKTDETEATKNKEAVVPSKEGAMGEDTSEGEAPQAEVVEPTEGSKVEIEPLIKNGMPRKMVYDKGEWKQEVGGDLISVAKKVQEEADSKFKQLNTKENAVQESKTESLLPREQGEVREARSEREGVGQGEQGQEPTKASEEEVTLEPIEFSKQLENKYGVIVDLLGKSNKGDLTLSRIEVPSSERGEGIGSDVMNDIIKYADANGRRIVLTPSTDFGATSVERLKDFYKRFGFVENKGKNKDFSTKESMYREPKQSNIETESNTQSGIKAEPKVESVPEKVQKEAKVEKEYKEAISKKSERSKNIAKENFINDNFDKIVSQMMLNNKIKRKC